MSDTLDLDAIEARGRLAICPHPAPTNLCRGCEVKRRAERLRAQGIEVRDA